MHSYLLSNDRLSFSLNLWFLLFFFFFLLSYIKWDCLLQPILKVVLGVSTLSFKHKNPLEGRLHCGIRTNKIKMTSLSTKDKDTVRAFWGKLAVKREEVGASALCRYV